MFLSVLPYGIYAFLHPFRVFIKNTTVQILKWWVSVVFPFLGALAEFRKATISIAMSVRLSVRVEQLAPTGRIFVKYDTGVLFSKTSERI
jgi:hypothetical protein